MDSGGRGGVSDSLSAAERGISAFAQEASVSSLDFAEILGFDASQFKEDPLIALDAWEDYIDRLPLEEFEAGDWKGLRTDIAAYLAEVLIRRSHVAWNVIEDSSAPRGYRYVLTRIDGDGDVRSMDPFEFIIDETDLWPFRLSVLLVKAEVKLGIIGASDGE